MLPGSHDEQPQVTSIRSPRMLATVPPAQQRVLKAFYAGHLPAGQLCAALASAATEAAHATPAGLAAPAARAA